MAGRTANDFRAEGIPTEGIDYLLAYAPWRSLSALVRYAEHLRAGTLPAGPLTVEEMLRLFRPDGPTGEPTSAQAPVEAVRQAGREEVKK